MVASFFVKLDEIKEISFAFTAIAPPFSAWLLLKSQYSIWLPVAGVLRYIAPPSSVALLLLKLELVIYTFPMFTYTPPAYFATFSVKLQLSILPLLLSNQTVPLSLAVFLSNIQLVILPFVSPMSSGSSGIYAIALPDWALLLINVEFVINP